MRVFPIRLLSNVRGLIRRAPPSSRWYVVPALAWKNPTLSHSEQFKEGKFNGNALELNEIGVLRVIASMRDDPYLALSFLKQIEGNGASPTVNAYAAVLRIFLSSGLDDKLEPILVQLVRKGDKVRGFCDIDLLNAIGLEEAQEERNGASSLLLLSRVSSALVKAYASIQMYDEAIDVFYKTKDVGCASPNIKAFNFLMNRMIASGENVMAVSCFWQIVKSVGLDVDAETYVLLVKAYSKLVCGLCNEMKIDAAEELFLDMEKRGIGPDVCVYSAMIEGHRKNMNIPKALEYFWKMVEKKIRINRVIISSVLQCYCQMGKFLEAYDLFNEFRDMNIYLDNVCYNVAFDALGKVGKVEEAIELFREMIGKGIAPDVVNYTTLIDGCCLQGKCSVAYDLMIEMEETGKTPDSVIYNVLAGGFARNGLVQKAFETLKRMEAWGVKPTSVTHNMVIEGLIVAGEIDEAEAFYESLEHKSREASRVKGYCEAGRLDQAFERFIKLETPLPRNVYLPLFISLCAEKENISKAQDLLDRLWELGVEPEKSIYRRLIGAWCRVDNVRKAWRLFKDLVDKGIIPDVYTYTVLINTYCRLNNLEKAYALFKDMKRRGIKPDVVTYTVLVNSNPELDLKREMNAFDVQPDVVYYTVLIDQQCKIGDLHEADRIFVEMIENGLKPDAKTYTALIVAYCRNGYVREAVTLRKEMSKNGIELTKASQAALRHAILKAKSNKIYN